MKSKEEVLTQGPITLEEAIRKALTEALHEINKSATPKEEEPPQGPITLEEAVLEVLNKINKDNRDNGFPGDSAAITSLKKDSVVHCIRKNHPEIAVLLLQTKKEESTINERYRLEKPSLLSMLSIHSIHLSMRDLSTIGKIAVKMLKKDLEEGYFLRLNLLKCAGLDLHQCFHDSMMFDIIRGSEGGAAVPLRNDLELAALSCDYKDALNEGADYTVLSSREKTLRCIISGSAHNPEKMVELLLRVMRINEVSERTMAQIKKLSEDTKKLSQSIEGYPLVKTDSDLLNCYYSVCPSLQKAYNNFLNHYRIVCLSLQKADNAHLLPKDLCNIVIEYYILKKIDPKLLQEATDDSGESDNKSDKIDTNETHADDNGSDDDDKGNHVVSKKYLDQHCQALNEINKSATPKEEELPQGPITLEEAVLEVLNKINKNNRDGGFSGDSAVTISLKKDYVVNCIRKKHLELAVLLLQTEKEKSTINKEYQLEKALLLSEVWLWRIKGIAGEMLRKDLEEGYFLRSHILKYTGLDLNKYLIEIINSPVGVNIETYQFIKSLIYDLGADVNTRSLDDRTLLHKASSYGNCELAILLINANIDANAICPWGTALDGLFSCRLPCEYPSEEIVELLLRITRIDRVQKKTIAEIKKLSENTKNISLVKACNNFLNPDPISKEQEAIDNSKESDTEYDKTDAGESTNNSSESINKSTNEAVKKEGDNRDSEKEMLPPVIGSEKPPYNDETPVNDNGSDDDDKGNSAVSKKYLAQYYDLDSPLSAFFENHTKNIEAGWQEVTKSSQEIIIVIDSSHPRGCNSSTTNEENAANNLGISMISYDQFFYYEEKEDGEKEIKILDNATPIGKQDYYLMGSITHEDITSQSAITI